MSTRDQQTGPSEPPPSAAMLQLIAGFWVSRALYIAAKLGIADLLAAGPQAVSYTHLTLPTILRV